MEAESRRPMSNIAKGLFAGEFEHKISDTHAVFEEFLFAHLIGTQTPASETRKGIVLAIVCGTTVNRLKQTFDSRSGEKRAKTSVGKGERY